MFASLVLLMAAAKRKEGLTGASSGHITNLKQSILETFSIYGYAKGKQIANRLRHSYLNVLKLEHDGPMGEFFK